MIRTLSTLALTLISCLLVSCVSHAPQHDRWAGLDTDANHYLSEGGSISARVNDRAIVHITVTDGHLYLNDQDLGPHAGTQPIRFLKNGDLVIGGEVRGRAPID